MSICIVPTLTLLLLTARPSAQQAQVTFDDAAAGVRQQLEQSMTELDQLRARMAEEKLPLARRLAELEAELLAARLEYQQTTRLLDSRTLDLSNQRSELQAREEEAAYLSNLLGEYARNFESRLHVAELQRYRAALEEARLAPENGNLSRSEVFAAQAALLALSLERLHDALGGARFAGSAVDSAGIVRPGTFALLGPMALFRSADGQVVGTAEQRLGSLEPAVLGFEDPALAAEAAQVVLGTGGRFPFDPTQGNAHKIEDTRETLLEHVKRGGPVMVPIFALAMAALLVALYKWLRLSFVRKPSPKRVRLLLEAVARRDRPAAAGVAESIGGPAGKMLRAGVEHLDEPRELIEEVMYETVLATRLQLQHLLPFVAITASSAPLLGLLGTVTGIMNTFTLMTVFGTGDVKTLSSGISEALITTECGLYVAIPSLLLHAFLSRKARGVIDSMEQAAVAFVNQVARSPQLAPARLPQDESRADAARLERLAAPTA